MDATLGLAEDLHSAVPQDNLCDGPESCRRAVRTQIRRGVDVIKIATTGGVNSRIGAGLGRQIFDDEVKALVDTAHLYGKKVAVHAHGADGINAALAAGADSIEHGTLLDDEGLRLFKAKRRLLRPHPVDRERLSRADRRRPQRLRARRPGQDRLADQDHRRGAARRRSRPACSIAFGTDAGVSKHGRNADEFELMVRHGMTPADRDRGGDRQRRRAARPGRARSARSSAARAPTSSPSPATRSPT